MASVWLVTCLEVQRENMAFNNASFVEQSDAVDCVMDIIDKTNPAYLEWVENNEDSASIYCKGDSDSSVTIKIELLPVAGKRPNNHGLVSIN